MSDLEPNDPAPPAAGTPDQGSLLPPAGYAQGTPPPPWEAPPVAPAPEGGMWHRIAAFIVLIAVVAAAAGMGIGFSAARLISGQPAAGLGGPESPITAAPATGGSPGGASSIASRVYPALVEINTTVGTSAAAGTGMIISPTGEILTNNHVVAGSTSITVTVASRNQRYSAHVVGVNVSQDVAVVQVDRSVTGLPTVQFARTSSLNVGQDVFALGNALGQGLHSESGHVTALDQTITASEGGGQSETLNGLIQSDALIYEGDSGGALVNSSAQVVGMITAGQAEGFRSSASSVGYAIPSDTALGIVNRIRARDQSADLTYGQIGYLGVQVQNFDAANQAQLGLNVSSGALVVAVVPNSPASEAGIPRYSVITELGGKTVDSADTLGPVIKSHKPGDQVSVTWVDASGTHSSTATLGGVNP